MNREWPYIAHLPWIYSQKAIIKDFTDSVRACSLIISMITNTIDEHYVKQFIKWMKLVIDNVEQHYRIKHRYYFPKLNFPICNELLEDFKPILELLKKSKQHIKNVSILKVKQENNKETLCQHITELYTDIQQIILLIKKNFKKEKIKLLPKMIHEINYADIRAIDIKIGVRSKWYALPHLYRDVPKKVYQDHMDNVLMIPTITQKTTIALHFKRYNYEYRNIIENLFPDI